MESDFHLAKWYFDCITGDGEACIGYASTVRWKKLTLRYTSLLCAGPQRPVMTSTTHTVSDFPVLRNDRIEWVCPELDAGGTWCRRAPAVERTLLENEHGFIRWNCVMPGADASVRIGSKHGNGLGYVEFLEMTIPPWKMPIEQLRWGRFVAPEDAVVWIEWSGPHPLNFIYHNGSEITMPQYSDSRISSRDGSFAVELDRAAVIRSGSVLNTVLKKIPGIDLVFPKNILHTDEHKWISGCTFHRPDHSIIIGQAIHELVRFI
ncbi:MAG: hypothetical protein WCW35_11810 [Bacteroidota bacterium]|jgi:hypothetical protein